MKILEKITLIIYSYVILLASVLLCLLVFKCIDINMVANVVNNIIVGETSSKILLGVCAVFILLSIKCIFFDSTSKAQIKERQGVLLENENGKLMISKNTEEITTRVELDKDNNVNVFANIVVSNDAVIKELSASLQTAIKEKVKIATDLEVKEVNIKVNNVAPKQETTTA